MAEPLKNMFSPKVIRSIANHCKTALKYFNVNKFEKFIFDIQWDEKALKERIKHIADGIYFQLKGEDFLTKHQQLKTLADYYYNLIGDALTFDHIYLQDIIENYGVDFPKQALPLIESITRFASGEFAVRPFLIRYPELMYDQMYLWSKNPNPFIRRLASEGIRPSLPWGKGVPELKKNIQPILKILDELKSDTNLSVKKSVANNLNDISKFDAKTVLDLSKKWLKLNNEHTNWVVRHACRTLIKQGNKEALTLFGINTAVDVYISNFKLQQSKIRIGDTLSFNFKLTSSAEIKVRVSYAIYYLKKSGAHNPKVFKIYEGTLIKEGDFEKKQSFHDMTTRKHYLGKHYIAIIVNGNELDRKSFTLY